MDLDRVTRELSLQLNRIALLEIAIKPTQPVLLIEGITNESVVEWLETKGSQEFGRFSVKDIEDKRQVAGWFIKQIRDYYTFTASKFEHQ